MNTVTLVTLSKKSLFPISRHLAMPRKSSKPAFNFKKLGHSIEKEQQYILKQRVRFLVDSRIIKSSFRLARTVRRSFPRFQRSSIMCKIFSRKEWIVCFRDLVHKKMERYKCRHCEAKFAYKQKLDTHLNNEHKAKPYQVRFWVTLRMGTLQLFVTLHTGSYRSRGRSSVL